MFHATQQQNTTVTKSGVEATELVTGVILCKGSRTWWYVIPTKNPQKVLVANLIGFQAN